MSAVTLTHRPYPSPQSRHTTPLRPSPALRPPSSSHCTYNPTHHTWDHPAGASCSPPPTPDANKPRDAVARQASPSAFGTPLSTSSGRGGTTMSGLGVRPEARGAATCPLEANPCQKVQAHGTQGQTSMIHQQGGLQHQQQQREQVSQYQRHHHPQQQHPHHQQQQQQHPHHHQQQQPHQQKQQQHPHHHQQQQPHQQQQQQQQQQREQHPHQQQQHQQPRCPPVAPATMGPMASQPSQHHRDPGLPAASTQVLPGGRASATSWRRLEGWQIEFLERCFAGGEVEVDRRRKEQLAAELGVKPRQVAVWFQNRRGRWALESQQTEASELRASLSQLQKRHEDLQSQNQGLQRRFQELERRYKELQRDNRRLQESQGQTHGHAQAPDGAPHVQGARQEQGDCAEDGGPASSGRAGVQACGGERWQGEGGDLGSAERDILRCTPTDKPAAHSCTAPTAALATANVTAPMTVAKIPLPAPAGTPAPRGAGPASALIEARGAPAVPTDGEEGGAPEGGVVRSEAAREARGQLAATLQMLSELLVHSVAHQAANQGHTQGQAQAQGQGPLPVPPERPQPHSHGLSQLAEVLSGLVTGRGQGDGAPQVHSTQGAPIHPQQKAPGVPETGLACAPQQAPAAERTAAVKPPPAQSVHASSGTPAVHHSAPAQGASMRAQSGDSQQGACGVPADPRPLSTAGEEEASPSRKRKREDCSPAPSQEAPGVSTGTGKGGSAPAPSRAHEGDSASMPRCADPSGNLTCDMSAKEEACDGRAQEGAELGPTCGAVTSADASGPPQPPLLRIPPPRSHLRHPEGSQGRAAAGAHSDRNDTENPHIQIPQRSHTGDAPGSDCYQAHEMDLVRPGLTPSGFAALSPFSVAQELTQLLPSPHFLWNPPTHSPGQAPFASHLKSSPFEANALHNRTALGSQSDAPGWPFSGAEQTARLEGGSPSEFHGEC